MNEALRIILPAYLAAFFLIAFVWRSYLVYKRTGINPYVVGKTKRPIDFLEAYYRVPTLVILATTLAYSFLPSAYVYASPILWMDAVQVKIGGLILMAFALAWTATAQMQMGKSWRIGIDHKHKTELIDQGLFAVSRNPISGHEARVIGILSCIAERADASRGCAGGHTHADTGQARGRVSNRGAWQTVYGILDAGPSVDLGEWL
ncbi:MAG: hypothetical protein WKF34_06255 [Pyrinomonadaceae bacterium]